MAARTDHRSLHAQRLTFGCSHHADCTANRLRINPRQFWHAGTRDQKKRTAPLRTLPPYQGIPEAELRSLLPLRHHRCLAHLRQYTVEFPSLDRCDDSFDCRDELFFFADSDRRFAWRKFNDTGTVAHREHHRAGRISSPPHGFYGVITASTLIGVVIDFLGLDPIRLLVYTSVLNGVAAVPLILLIILISRNRRIMGEHASGRLSVGFNWLAFGTMAGATLAALVTLLQGK